MGTTEVYWNGMKLKLDPSKVVALTKQVVDLNSLREIRSDFTNSVEVEDNDVNKLILENIDVINSLSELPYVKGSARIVVDGVEVVSNGIGLIESAGSKFKLSVYSGNKSWINLTEGKSIKDLDFIAERHIWNASAFEDSHENNRAYVYAVCEYGYGKTYRPWVYTKEIFERIFSEIGYSIQGDVLTNERYLKSIIETSHIEAIPEFFMGEAIVDEGFGSIDLIQDDLAPFPGQESWLRFPTETVDPMEPYAPPGIIEQNPPAWFVGGQRTVYNCLKAGTYTFELYLDFEQMSAVTASGNYNSVNVGWQILWFINGAPAVALGETVIISPGGGAPTRNQVTVRVQIEMTGPGYIAGLVRATNLIFDANRQWNFRLYNTSSFKCTEVLLDNATGVNDLVDLSAMLPDISQAEFVKAIAYMLGVVVIPDENTRTITLRRWNELNERRGEAYDWSSKLDTLKKPEIKFRLGSWAQSNYLKYAPVDDVVEGYGDGVMSIVDDWISPSRDIYVSPFSACMPSAGGVPIIPRQELVGLSADWVNGDNPRILMTEVQGSQTVLGVPLAQYKFAYFRIPTKADSIGWDLNLIPDNYRFVEIMIERPKILTCDFMLGAQDVHDFDHFRPVYIRQFAEYFFVNKISNWIASKPTQVELIRL